MERQHGLNNQQRSLFRGHPNMNGEPSPVHKIKMIGTSLTGGKNKEKIINLK